MMYNEMTNNKLTIAGVVNSKPELCHEAYGEKFYTFTIESPRLSDSVDEIPVMISEKILGKINVGQYVQIDGQLRTYNKYEEEKRRLLLFAFVRDIKVITEEDFKEIENPNIVEINGFICKDAVYRQTPFKREICDLLIAVNRAYKKSDYIPVIAWGRNARYSGNLEVGTKVKVVGRIQSRTYEKKIDEENKVTKVAYEVSVSNITAVNESEENVAE